MTPAQFTDLQTMLERYAASEDLYRAAREALVEAVLKAFPDLCESRAVVEARERHLAVRAELLTRYEVKR